MQFGRSLLVALGLALLPLSVAESKETKLSDDQVAKILIKESIDNYPGNCPCPYNVDRAGRSCGRRSAYSKPGGYSPLCYRKDVTDPMIEAYRKGHE
ncbi:MAG: hypothetical protein HY791_14975 [Deltaproteobacteria bacterium]|nr:hypothetical protein [Deltaproteobacteria bacterium]